MSYPEQWEYRFLDGPWKASMVEGVQRELNQLGASGWEVVASVDIPGEAATYAPSLLLKRRR